MTDPAVERVAVVVLNWNGVADTFTCLDALAAQRRPDLAGPHDPVVIVVDNGSTDDSVAKLRLRSERGEIVLLENESNRGFAGGVNVGIRHALNEGFDAIALLNNDAVPEPTWLEELVRAMTRTDAAIVTGLLLDERGGKIDSAGDAYSWWGMPFPRGRDDPAASAPASGYVAAASGGATLYRASVFRDVGLFDEEFFAYFEDVDLSLRAQARLHRIYYTDRATALHVRGASSSRVAGFTTFQSFKNLPLVAIKNVPARHILRVGARFALLYAAMLVNAIRTGRARPALRGVSAALRLTFAHALPERRRIQHERRLSSAGFARLMSPHNPWRRRAG